MTSSQVQRLQEQVARLEERDRKGEARLEQLEKLCAQDGNNKVSGSNEVHT